jgi:hypothetical protein
MSTALRDVCTWLLINAIVQPFIVWMSVRMTLSEMRKSSPVLSGISASDFPGHPFVMMQDGLVRYSGGASHPLPWKLALSQSLFWPGWLLMFSLAVLARLSGTPLLLSIAVGVNAGLVILLPVILLLKSRHSRWVHAHLDALAQEARPDAVTASASIVQIA